MIQSLKRVWGNLLRPQRGTSSGKWLALYVDNISTVPVLVYQANQEFSPKLGPGYLSVPLTTPIFQVLQRSASLEVILDDARMKTARIDHRKDCFINEVAGSLHRVRVMEITRGPK